MSVFTLNALAEGMRKSADRMRSIRAARDAKRQKDEEFELNKKLTEAKIEALKHKSGNDPMLNILEEQLGNQFDLQEAQSEVNDDMIDNAFRTEEEKQQTLKRTGKKMATSLMRQSPGLDWSYNTGSRSFNVRQADPNKVSTLDHVMGNLDSGGVYKQDGTFSEFGDRKSAEQYVNAKLGYGWKNKYPQVVRMLDEKDRINKEQESESAAEKINKDAPAPTGPLNPLRALPGYANYGADKRGAYNSLRAKGVSKEEAKRRLGLK